MTADPRDDGRHPGVPPPERWVASAAPPVTARRRTGFPSTSRPWRRRRRAAAIRVGVVPSAHPLTRETAMSFPALPRRPSSDRRTALGTGSATAPVPRTIPPPATAVHEAL